MRGLPRWILWPILILALPGCAPPQSVPTVTPEERLGIGLAAWQMGDYRLAELELSQLATDPPTPEFGQRARLFLAAIELDPRNQTREPSNSAALAAELLSDPAVSRSNSSLGEILYLLARDLGAAAPPDTTQLPRLPGTPIASRLHKLQLELDEQRKETTRLQQELKQKDEEIQKLARELERIRKTMGN
jgi:hypothetical protein